MARIFQRKEKRLADRPSQLMTKVKQLRCTNQTRRKIRRCGTLRASRKMTRRDPNETGVTKLTFPPPWSRFKEKFIKILFNFDFTGDSHLRRMKMAKHRIELSRRTRSQSILSHTGQVQKVASLRIKKWRKCCRKEVSTLLKLNRQHE